MSRGTTYDWLRSPVDVRKVVGLKWVVFCLVVELGRGVCYLGGLPLLVNRPGVAGAVLQSPPSLIN